MAPATLQRPRHGTRVKKYSRRSSDQHTVAKTSTGRTQVAKRTAKTEKEPVVGGHSSSDPSLSPDGGMLSALFFPPAVGSADTGAWPSTEYHENDRIVGHVVSENDHLVRLVTIRSVDESRRVVSEADIQRATPSKLYAYWEAFGKPREQTIGVDHFNAFAIVGHDARGKRLRVQWVGYSDSSDDTSWEPVSKMRRIHAGLLDDYLFKYSLNDKLMEVSRSEQSPRATTSATGVVQRSNPGPRSGIRDDVKYKVTWKLVGISGADLRRLSRVILDINVDQRITHRSVMVGDTERSETSSDG